MPKILSVNVSFPKEVDFEGQKVTTGIFKEPIDGRIMLRTLNLEGDKQADLTVHGGPDKAVYAYPIEHYEFWLKVFPNMEKLVISMNDFDYATREITPSAMREVYVEPPDVKWEDIGGLDTVKMELQEAVEWPMRFPQMYKQLGHTVPKGILLHGPSGTGKTMLAKAVATESEANFISVKGPELMSKWVGESEKGIRDIFRKARQASPCVIFFDEVDSIAAVRGGALFGGFGNGGGAYSGSERMISQLLTEMDGMQEMHDIVVIAATNRVDMIDTALLRPGRFDKIIYIPNPDKVTRERILQIHIKGKPIKKDVNIDRIAEMTEGFSGADVSSVANTAVSLVLHDYIQKYPSPEEALKHASEALVSMRHFEDAIKKVRGQNEMKPEEKMNLSHYR